MASTKDTARWCEIRIVIDEEGAHVDVLRWAIGPHTSSIHAAGLDAAGTPALEPLPWAE